MLTRKRKNKFIQAIITRYCIYCTLSLAILLSGCTAMKFVPEDQVLYTGAEVKIIPSGKIRAKKKLKELLNSNINPQPNKSILGMRPALWVWYNTETPKKKKGFKHFIKNKIGQAPVYLSDVDPGKTNNLLKGTLINRGYFQAVVETDVTIKNKKAHILYTAYVNSPYRLREISTPTVDTLFTNIDSIRNNSYLKPGQRYNLERLQAEQSRIEEALENLGFYFFDDRYLLFEADSTVGDRKVDLTLTLEPGVPPKAKRIYKIDQINVFPDYMLAADATLPPADTVIIDGIHYIDRQKNYKPWIITKVINLAPHKIYTTTDRDYTLSHLMSLGSFKFVNIKFIESQHDSSSLHANIYLTPHLKKSLRGEIQATSKSNNFVGPGASISFTNRNFLKGSERFEVRVTTGYEVQISRQIPNPLNSFELGLESSLSVPRFITPFNIYYPSRRYLPATDVRAGLRVQNRIGYFKLNSINLSFGYTWRENTLKKHELYPVDINFVKLGKTSEEFNNRLKDNPFLSRSFEDQFILGARYSYTINTQIDQQRAKKFLEEELDRSNFFFSGTVDASGNLMRSLQGAIFKQHDETGYNKILGKVYSQFVRADVDFRHYWKFSNTTLLATRISGGIGYAYGNSVTMPYIKQFAVGGSNSVRAFPARTIGPGSYYIYEDTLITQSDNAGRFFIDQRGDVRIEGNAEYRLDFTKTIKGALFLDAGNIWLLRHDDNRPGGQFKKDNFMNEFAVGTGAGVRFDFNFFVLRFDLAFPLRKPWLKEGNRWVVDEIDFGSGNWRSNNLILNIAIGYPF
jgi:outer membrane protein insertion porin family